MSNFQRHLVTAHAKTHGPALTARLLEALNFKKLSQELPSGLRKPALRARVTVHVPESDAQDLEQSVNAAAVDDGRPKMSQAQFLAMMQMKHRPAKALSAAAGAAGAAERNEQKAA